jgi:hypothetical protein
VVRRATGYANQRRAIIAIEKGVSGECAFNEAFAAWESTFPSARAPSATNESVAPPPLTKPRTQYHVGQPVMVEAESILAGCDIAGIDESKLENSRCRTKWPWPQHGSAKVLMSAQRSCAIRGSTAGRGVGQKSAERRSWNA